ncbi:hypothetical protein AVEN_250024-1 [Araneus ventricosus]|uniref:Uncharacterized protein n=1 Tax=Araneus ventricosus TaxID=182803 RepID=A0A4Y2JYB5_ARAVE|nr:hypothetical protein AVEN_250024-1 [Araneus ventricosus]
MVVEGLIPLGLAYLVILLPPGTPRVSGPSESSAAYDIRNIWFVPETQGGNQYLMVTLIQALSFSSETSVGFSMTSGSSSCVLENLPW